MSLPRLPTYYLSHGGGPWPFMKAQFGTVFDALEASLVGLPGALPTAPRAVLVVSGHWECRDFTVSASAAPGMLYDYSGFPEPMYRIKYPAPGSPALALRVQGLLEDGGIACRSDPDRGFDHGTFSLMKPIYPDADVAVVQLSLQMGFEPARHIQVGRLLAPLRDEGILIVGSGLSYHNMGKRDVRGTAASGVFDGWLQETLMHCAPDERVERLTHWARAPAAREAHPREEHLLPLMVALGAAEHDQGRCVYHEERFFGTVVASSFGFGTGTVGVNGEIA